MHGKLLFSSQKSVRVFQIPAMQYNQLYANIVIDIAAAVVVGAVVVVVAFANLRQM